MMRSRTPVRVSEGAGTDGGRGETGLGGEANRVAHHGWGVHGEGMEEIISGSYLPVIQLAVTPVILLSGVGALMITLTNRMGRIVDRTRKLADQLRTAVDADRAH